MLANAVTASRAVEGEVGLGSFAAGGLGSAGCAQASVWVTAGAGADLDDPIGMLRCGEADVDEEEEDAAGAEAEAASTEELCRSSGGCAAFAVGEAADPRRGEKALTARGAFTPALRP
jgi:hypothetical protein